MIVERITDECILLASEVAAIEAARYDTYALALLNANDLANDVCDGMVYRVAGKYAVRVILN